MKQLLQFTILFLFGLSVKAQTTVSIVADKDNTLFESATGSLSNGAGDELFTGKTNNGEIRRTLLHFDFSSIPANATISSVSLSLQVTKQRGGSHSVALRRLTSDWGEGTSNASGQGGGGTSATSGDATWVHTFFNTSTWNTNGGDFVSQVSGTTTVSGNGAISITDPQMIIDVQNWVDGTNLNFGWLIIGDEGQNASAKRFASREHITNTFRPTLTITYNTSTSIEEKTVVAEKLFYPNPVNEQLNLSIDLSQFQSQLRIIGIDGKVVQETALESSASINVSDLAQGIYFLELTDLNGNIRLSKFIKQ